MTWIKTALKKLKDWGENLILIIFSPFIIYWVYRLIHSGLSANRDKLPSSFYENWISLNKNFFTIIALFTIGLCYGSLTNNEWAALIINGAIVVTTAYFVYTNTKRLFYFFVFPHTLGAFSEKLDELSNLTQSKVTEYIEASIKKDSAPAATFLLKLKDFLARIGTLYMKEILIRLSIIYFSVQFIAIVVFIILGYAAIFNYLHLVNPNHFTPSNPGFGFLDFLIYSFGNISTSDFGITAGDTLSRLLSVTQQLFIFIFVTLILPLVIINFERTVSFNENRPKVWGEFSKLVTKESVEEFSKEISKLTTAKKLLEQAKPDEPPTNT